MDFIFDGHGVGFEFGEFFNQGDASQTGCGDGVGNICHLLGDLPPLFFQHLNFFKSAGLMLAGHGPFYFQDAHQVIFVGDVAADGVQHRAFERGPADPFLITTGAAL